MDKYKYNTLLYEKKTLQPNLVNFIETEFINDRVKYKNSNIYIDRSDINIFSILYLMANNNKQIINKINIIEREGKYYNISIINENDDYELFLDEVNKDSSGLIRDTDIFLWGLFLPNTKKTVKVNKSGFIEQCVFKKGLLTVKAEIDYK